MNPAAGAGAEAACGERANHSLPACAVSCIAVAVCAGAAAARAAPAPRRPGCNCAGRPLNANCCALKGQTGRMAHGCATRALIAKTKSRCVQEPPTAQLCVRRPTRTTIGDVQPGSRTSCSMDDAGMQNTARTLQGCTPAATESRPAPAWACLLSNHPECRTTTTLKALNPEAQTLQPASRPVGMGSNAQLTPKPTLTV